LTQKNENKVKIEYLPTIIKTRMQFATCIKVNKMYACNAADGNRGKMIRTWDVPLNQWITDCDALTKW
jgi:hypothetical protein